MTNFNEKWQAIAARARMAPRRDEAAPFGFAQRVLASRSPAGPTVSLEVVWQSLTARSLALVTTVLVICCVIEGPHFRDRSPLEPGVENTIAQLLWSL